MDFNEYIQGHRIVRDLTEQIFTCNTAAVREFQVKHPDIITVMAYSAWLVFRQVSQKSIVSSSQCSSPFFDGNSFNGSRIFVIMNSEDAFFYYTLCRNLPPTPI
jgi:extradiol dioxygenase family protein